MFRRDDDGDLLFPLELAGGLEAVQIGVKTRVQMCRGEWFLNLDVGLPLLPTPDGSVLESQAILGQKFDPVKIRAAFLAEILTTPGVVDVPVLRTSLDTSTRVLTVTFVVRTQFGDTPEDSLDLEI